MSNRELSVPTISGWDVSHLILALAALQPEIERSSAGWAEPMKQAVAKALSLTTITPVIDGQQYVHVGKYQLVQCDGDCKACRAEGAR